MISVGNITVGGTGKTPATEFIASNLRDRGFKVAVLSRGYKGKKAQAINLVSDGDRIFLGPAEAGDEPYMLAKKLKGVPVVVGSDRHKIGRYAHERFGVDALILDDGFQHVRLRRDLNILLVDGKRGFGNGRIFPGGPLREPLSAINRADLLLVSKADSINPALEETIGRIAPSKALFRSTYAAKRLASVWGKSGAGIEALSGARVIALSAIATPGSFTGLIASLGAAVVDEAAFPDHHHYRPKDLDAVREKAVKAGADFIITTEKDAVKLERFETITDMPVYFLEIALDMGGKEDAFIDSVVKGSGLNAD